MRVSEIKFWSVFFGSTAFIYHFILNTCCSGCLQTTTNWTEWVPSTMPQARIYSRWVNMQGPSTKQRSLDWPNAMHQSWAVPLSLFQALCRALLVTSSSPPRPAPSGSRRGRKDPSCCTWMLPADADYRWRSPDWIPTTVMIDHFWRACKAGRAGGEPAKGTTWGWLNNPGGLTWGPEMEGPVGSFGPSTVCSSSVDSTDGKYWFKTSLRTSRDWWPQTPVGSRSNAQSRRPWQERIYNLENTLYWKSERDLGSRRWKRERLVKVPCKVVSMSETIPMW